MPGLSTSSVGLSYGTGLIYPIVANPAVQDIIFNGTSSLSVFASVFMLDTAETFAGSGNLNANAVVILAGSAAFAGSGNLAVDTLGFDVVTAFSGASTLSVSTTARLSAPTTFAGAGSLSAATTALLNASAAFAGSGNLAVNTLGLNLVITAAFAGAGSLSVNTSAFILDIAEVFAGASTLTANTKANLAALPSFGGAGALAYSGNLTLAANETFPGSGNLSATGLLLGTSTKSLTFTAASSQYLTITGNVLANRQKFTIATWFKRNSSGAAMDLYLPSDGTVNNFLVLRFTAGNNIQVLAQTATVVTVSKTTTATYTDTAAWHQLTFAVDTTQAVGDNRARLYVDSSEVTNWTSNTNPLLLSNLAINFASTYYIGRLNTGNSEFFDGNLTEFYYIDGQQLDPTSFVGGGLPKAYSGTYTGVFDFYLTFNNASSTTTLGNDSSGEANNWTLNNMTVANSSASVPTA